MMSSGTYVTRCGATGCEEKVSGIYCEKHKARMMDIVAPTNGLCPGERCWFDYRGHVKAGTVEKVMRSNAVVLIEVLGGRKQKLVTVKSSLLHKGEPDGQA